MIEKFIPDEVAFSVFEINYNKLYAAGYRLILIDLDNTILPYGKHEFTSTVIELLDFIKELGFEIIIASNSKQKRVKPLAQKLNLKYVHLSTKPLKRGLKKAIKKADRKYTLKEVIEIGDQVMTDVFASKRLGIYSILVQAIDRSTEKFSTRLNRLMEKKVMLRIKEKYPNEFASKLETYAKRNFDIW